MPDFGFDGVSWSLAEFMCFFLPANFCFQLFNYYVRNPDTTDNRQHTSSAGYVLQPAGYATTLHMLPPAAEQEATPHACGSLSALYCCGFLVAFVIGPCELQACGSLLLCDTCMPQVLQQTFYKVVIRYHKRTRYDTTHMIQCCARYVFQFVLASLP